MKPALSNRPVSIICIEEWNAPRGSDTPPAEQQGLGNPGLALIARDPVGKGRRIGDDPGREMRHHGESVTGETRGGRHHLFDRRAVDMGDIDARSLGKQGAKILDLLGGARHHLDRIVLKKRLDFGRGGRVRADFALEL